MRPLTPPSPDSTKCAATSPLVTPATQTFFEEVPQPDPSSVWGCDQFVHPALCITYDEYVCVQRLSHSGVPSGCECRSLNRFGLGVLSVCLYGWDSSPPLHCCILQLYQ